MWPSASNNEPREQPSENRMRQSTGALNKQEDEEFDSGIMWNNRRQQNNSGGMYAEEGSMNEGNSGQLRS